MPRSSPALTSPTYSLPHNPPPPYDLQPQPASPVLCHSYFSTDGWLQDERVKGYREKGGDGDDVTAINCKVPVPTAK